jgi:hypothetical protein
MRHISVQYGDGVRDNGIVGLGVGCFVRLDFFYLYEPSDPEIIPVELA